MARVRLLHWRREEATDYFALLGAAGYQVDYDEQFRSELMRQWRESPPDVFVIDLSRLPSQGREIAIALRQSPRTRRIPLVFCGGEQEKVLRVQRDLPDASFCELDTLQSTLKKALAKPPADPVKPTQMMDRYASRTVAQKLGIKESSTVLALDAPRDLDKVLGPLPEGAEIIDQRGAEAAVTLCFIQQPHLLAGMLSEVRELAGRSKLWILWRKGGSAARGDMTEDVVRNKGLELGLVDYKICSVNEVWSAMLFARKR